MLFVTNFITKTIMKSEIFYIFAGVNNNLCKKKSLLLHT